MVATIDVYRFINKRFYLFPLCLGGYDNGEKAEVVQFCIYCVIYKFN